MIQTFLSRLSRLSRLSPLYIVSILAAITFCCYFNTLGNGLFYDDEFFIYNNAYVQHFSFTNFFTQNVDAGGGVVSNYYRPFLLTLFSLTYQIFGPVGAPYHLLSIFFHITAGVGVFYLIKKFSTTMVAFFTALLFLIHPIQTESIAYASGISDPMYVTFSLLTLLSFLDEKRRLLFTPLFFLLALLSKEAAFITLLLLPLCAWMKEKSFALKTYRLYLSSFAVSTAVFGIYGLLRLTLLNFDNTLNFIHDTSPYSLYLSVRILTFLSILPTYLGLLLYPAVLFIDRMPAIVMTVTPGVLLTALVLFALGILAGILYKKYPVLLFSYLWFLISIIPASGITPINGIMYEHFLYFPSIGFFFLAINLFAFVYKKVSLPFIKNFLCILLATCYLLLAFRTIMRNADWNSPFTFYPQLLEHNPASIRALTNYGMALADSGHQKDAVTYYLRATRYSSPFPQVYFNLGNSYIALGEISLAENAYKKAIATSPAFYKAYQSLYELYKQTNQDEKAQKLLHEILERGKTDPNFAILAASLKQN